MTETKWRFWVDRGGTFTDIIARTPAGTWKTAKLLSENKDQYDDAAAEGVRRLMNAGAPLLAENIEAVHIGTTVATNALLERRGARTALAVTKGFRDQLFIGYQTRPDLSP